MSNIFIPKKLKVGFQTRQDTFTGRLAYVIYYDAANELRKETSWNSWRDKSIAPIEIDNVLSTGFVVNKGLQRCGHFGSGRSVIRVFHPKGFEFEITVDNLVALLMHSDVSKRDIQEECILAWNNTSLILLPKNSEEYANAIKFTDKANKELSARSLIVGATYSQKKSNDAVVYIGYREYFNSDNYSITNHVSKGKKHIFVNSKLEILALTPSTHLAECIDTETAATYEQCIIAFYESKHSQACEYVFAPIVRTEVYGSHNVLMFTDGEYQSLILGLDSRKDMLTLTNAYGIADINFKTGVISYTTKGYYNSKIKDLPGIPFSTIANYRGVALTVDACNTLFTEHGVGIIRMKLVNTGKII